MKIIVKWVLVLLAFFNCAYGCAVCSVEVPTVDVYVDIYQKENTTLTYAVRWKFHEKFTQEAFIPYDKNKNKKFEPKELEEIKNTFLEYLVEANFLAYIKYYHESTYYKSVGFIPFSVNNVKVQKDGENMFLTFELEHPLVLQKNHSLYVRFYDVNGFFNFTMKSVSLKGVDFNYKTQLESNSAKLFFSEDFQVQKSSLDEKKEQKQSYLLSYLSKTMEEISVRLNDLLKSIKEKNSILSYMWLFVFSFFYGIVHAIGPGHGKSLVSAYFLTENKSYIKAFNMSALIGIIHTLSAFLLTLAVYFILNNFLGMYLQSVERTSIKISAIIIIIIALYLIYKKLRPKKQNYNFSQAYNITLAPNSSKHAYSCGCSACKTNSTDLGVTISAGIVPCPGTVTIFIFTMSLGLYWVGIFSALFMSMGMSLIIFIMALLSIKIRKKVEKKPWVITSLEYFSLLFILGLGVILVLVTN